MIRYLLARLAGAVPTLLIIVTLAFFLLHAAPGGPFDFERALAPGVKAAIEHRYHLDEPLYAQYFRYVGALLRGDLGPSFQYRGTTVNDLVRQGFPIDMEIGMAGFLLALVIGVPIGIMAALRPNTALDYWPMTLAVLGISIPPFVVAPLLILVFAVALHWLPAGGWETGHPADMVLPALALAAPYIAFIARIMRGSMLEVLESPFIRTARAKGLSTRQVIFAHALRPALMPLVSFIGPAAAGILTGSLVIEQVFGLPGIGRYFVESALNRDYTVVLGVTELYGALILLFNLLADLAYALIDPRVRYR